MKHRSITTTLMGMGFVVMALLMGVSSTALAAGTLTVDKPNDSVRYVAGMSYFIEWTPGNAGATVKIELLKAGKRTKWVTTKTANDGEFIWKIPKSVKKNSKYKIKITSTKNSSIYDQSDSTFTIYNASNWWKEDFGEILANFDGINLGIEDDGTGTWGEPITSPLNPHNRWNLEVVPGKSGHPVRRGKQSIRFEVRPGDCGTIDSSDSDCSADRQSERSEVYFSTHQYPGNEYWYAWSVYFKNYKPMNNVSPIHGQFKSIRGDNLPIYLGFLSSSDGLTAQLELRGVERLYDLISLGNLSNKWHDFVVNVKWSTGADGFVKIWVNGKLLVNKKGANVQSKHGIRFAFGTYRPNLYRTSNRNIKHIVYYDELVRGDSCEDVSQFMTCPGGGSLKVTSPNGKEKWKTKKKYTIKWKKGKAGTYVKIQLLKKGKLYRTIAAKTKNDGKHAWKVPSTLVNSAAYKVKITSTKNKKLTDSSDNNFTIKK